LDYNIRGQTLIQYSVQDQSQPGINSSNISPNRQLEHDSPLSSSSILLAVKQKVAPLSQCVVSSFQLASPHQRQVRTLRFVPSAHPRGVLSALS
jgi:hypothetical protein